MPLYLCMPTLVQATLSSGSALPLYGFCGAAALAVASMGGVYALLPAYEADLFGTKYVGAIHGRMLLYSAAAALFGTFSTRSLSRHGGRPVSADLPPVLLRARRHHGPDR